jgi:hypothetical protein
MGETARRTFVATLVVGVVALALALWKLKIVIALVFFGFVIAAAMRPSVDRLAALRIPGPLEAWPSTTWPSRGRSRSCSG